VSGEFQEVVQLLQTYFDGLYFSDTSRLAGVFHPKARYVTATEDQLVDLGIGEYLSLVAARTPPASREEQRRDGIVAIEFAGSRTAFARVNCAIGPKYFTDFLTLIRSDGQWRIIAKVFHHEPLPDEV
jgi:hypothetical protein